MLVLLRLRVGRAQLLRRRPGGGPQEGQLIGQGAHRRRLKTGDELALPPRQVG
jgi:hypothetical protein